MTRHALALEMRLVAASSVSIFGMLYARLVRMCRVFHSLSHSSASLLIGPSDAHIFAELAKLYCSLEADDRRWNPAYSLPRLPHPFDCFNNCTTVGIKSTGRIVEGICICINPASEPNRITLNIPPSARIIISEVVVV